MEDLKIGDEFKFIPLKSLPIRNACKFPNKTFIVYDVRGIGLNVVVFYIDNRTSSKCKCRNCSRKKVSKYRYGTNIEEEMPYKSVSISECILVRTKYQREREIALNIILGKK